MSNTIAFVFPGQGSQSIGMQQALAQKYPLVKELYQQASDILHYDVWKLVVEGPEEVLNQTQYTQPALLVAGVCAWRIWKAQQKPLPAYLAGHSLGEYTALVCADVLSFEEAIRLVSKRGLFMQQSVLPGVGAMAAIVGLNEAEIIAICQEAKENEVLSPANYNAIGQTVIAGHSAAVERAIKLAKSKGAKLTKILAVSVPSHCELMKEAALQLEEELASVNLSLPTLPVIHNDDVCIHQDPKAIKNALVKQLYSPVRWVETILFLSKNGINTIYECGPGNVLSGLIKRIDKNIKTISLNQPENYELSCQ